MMKQIVYISAFLLLIGFSSCQEAEYMLFDEFARVQMDESEEIKVDFFYMDDAVKRDTVYLTVHTIGYPENRDRKIALQQIPEYDIEYQYDNKGNLIDSIVTEKPNKAIPGVHYIAMDDSEMENLLVIRSDSVTMEIPIILLRDTSLQRKEFRLCLQLVATEDFLLGEHEHLSGTIIVTDKLSKPGFWTTAMEAAYFGVYSTRKHEFMYEVAGEKIDDEWCNRIKQDYAEFTYYIDKFKNALAEYNSNPENIAAGLAPMREDQNNPNSPLIVFP